MKGYLKEVRAKFEAGNDITYISLQKESHLLEIPQVGLSSVHGSLQSLCT